VFVVFTSLQDARRYAANAALPQVLFVNGSFVPFNGLAESLIDPKRRIRKILGEVEHILSRDSMGPVECYFYFSRILSNSVTRQILMQPQQTVKGYSLEVSRCWSELMSIYCNSATEELLIDSEWTSVKMRTGERLNEYIDRFETLRHEYLRYSNVTLSDQQWNMKLIQGLSPEYADLSIQLATSARYAPYSHLVVELVDRERIRQSVMPKHHFDLNPIHDRQHERSSKNRTSNFKGKMPSSRIADNRGSCYRCGERHVLQTVVKRTSLLITNRVAQYVVCQIILVKIVSFYAFVKLTPVSDVIVLVTRPRFAIVVTDIFSGFVAAEALQSMSSVNVVTALKDIFCREGYPIKIRLDNGKSFRSDLFIQSMTALKIRLSFIPVYSPMYGGAYEVSHKAINKCLKILSWNTNSPWYNLLQEACLSVNSSPRFNSTSPFEINRTYPPRRFDTLLPDWQKERPPTLPHLLRERQLAEQRIADVVDSISRENREKIRRAIDEKCNNHTQSIDIGDKVWVMSKPGPKLSPSWQGPALVVARSGNTCGILLKTNEYEIHRASRLRLGAREEGPCYGPHVSLDWIRSKMFNNPANHLSPIPLNSTLPLQGLCKFKVADWVAWSDDTGKLCFGKVVNVDVPTRVTVHVYQYREPDIFPLYFDNELGVASPSLITVQSSSCRRLLIHANGTLSRETLRIFRSSNRL
jgi:hypothetical protein